MLTLLTDKAHCYSVNARPYLVNFVCKSLNHPAKTVKFGLFGFPISLSMTTYQVLSVDFQVF